jgi:hypothetical protein
MDMGTRWNSHSRLETLIEFLRALRERGLEVKWPESQDVAVIDRIAKLRSHSSSGCWSRWIKCNLYCDTFSIYTGISDAIFSNELFIRFGKYGRRSPIVKTIEQTNRNMWDDMD